MDESLKSIIDRFDEFVARDLNYIVAGYLVSFSFMNSTNSIKLVAAETSETIPIWMMLIATAPFAWVVGYVSREVLAILGVSTTKQLDSKRLLGDKGGTLTPWRVFKVVRISKYFLEFKPSEGATGDSDSIVDQRFKGIMHVSRSYRVYQRAIFLKEILSTLGSSLALSGLILLISNFLRGELSMYAFDGAAVAQAGMLFVGLIASRFSLYHAFRQGSLVKKFREEVENEQAFLAKGQV